ncbi:MAG: hypothetical protein P8J87_10225, partial [Verrucomicrobiales bacterium]|nr:hypothetical protein [Verrucomicrobiales bacterium]
MKSILVLLASTGIAHAFSPGTESTFDHDLYPTPAVVYIPENYTPERKFPVVFNYPGTSGPPNTHIPKAYTLGQDFVVVGLQYATEGKPKLTRDYLEIEIEALRSIRTQLASKISIDPGRSYVGGFSKGGWFASEFAESTMRDFAGAYILGAGKNHRRVRKSVPFGTTRKPVYIGIGHQDPNYIYSVRAVPFFRKLGATVTFDDYLNRGHDVPMGSAERDLSPAFRHWWQIEAARVARPKIPITTQATEWASRMVAYSYTLESPLHRYLHLRQTLRDPFVAILPKDASNALRDALKETAGDPALATELSLEKKYRLLVDKESSTESWQHYLSSARAYHQLYSSAPGSHAGKMAGLGYARLSALLGMSNRWTFATTSERDRAQADLTA